MAKGHPKDHGAAFGRPKDRWVASGRLKCTFILFICIYNGLVHSKVHVKNEKNTLSYSRYFVRPEAHTNLKWHLGKSMD